MNKAIYLIKWKWTGRMSQRNRIVLSTILLSKKKKQESLKNKKILNAELNYKDYRKKRELPKNKKVLDDKPNYKGCKKSRIKQIKLTHCWLNINKR